MKLRIKQRFFSILDTFDIYDMNDNVVYSVKSQFDLTHHMHVYDAQGTHVGELEQVMFRLFPTFKLYAHGDYIGRLKKQATFFIPKYELEMNDWQVQGDFLEWDYRIVDPCGRIIATIHKEVPRWTDTYILDIHDEEDPLCALLIVLGIDAEKCSRLN